MAETREFTDARILYRIEPSDDGRLRISFTVPESERPFVVLMMLDEARVFGQALIDLAGGSSPG